MKHRIFNDHYEDIMELPHHISPTRSQMSRMDRAAQFSPFTALTGHQEAIKETEKMMKEKIVRDGSRVPIDEIYELNENIFVE